MAHDFILLKTYIRPEVVGVSEEGVEDLPGGHDDYVDGEQDPHYQEQLGVLHHLDQEHQWARNEVNEASCGWWDNWFDF